MRTLDERLEKLEQALIETYRARQMPPWEAKWGESVMQEIRRVARRQPPVRRNDDVAHLVWRTAGFAAALAVLLVVLLMIVSPHFVIEESGLVAEEIHLVSLFLE
ncbi:MAG: hypothetical protein LV473_16815 [Nitrospira sp.]|nr:hypothetical protein [Nitrospira sp.]